jgi:hypothetical protein
MADHIPSLNAGLRAGAVGQNGRHLQPVAERIEDQASAIEDFRLSCVFVVSK